MSLSACADTLIIIMLLYIAFVLLNSDHENINLYLLRVYTVVGNLNSKLGTIINTSNSKYLIN